jgi:uncharacterized membrane protein
MDFSGFYTYFSPEVATFLVSMLPVAELRVSIPLAIGVYHMEPLRALLISFLGNIVPVFFILLLIGRISDFLSRKSAFFKKFFTKLFERTRRKNSESFEKWGTLALVIFVAIPLPMTGGWSGAVAAFVFGVPFRKAFASVSLGVFIAGVIVTALTLGIL